MPAPSLRTTVLLIVAVFLLVLGFAARPYSEKIREVIASLSRAGATVSHPLLEVREPVRVGVLTVTADRGLMATARSSQ